MGEERNSMQTFFTNKATEGEILPGLFLLQPSRENAKLKHDLEQVPK